VDTIDLRYSDARLSPEPLKPMTVAFGKVGPGTSDQEVSHPPSAALLKSEIIKSPGQTVMASQFSRP
jgi:hypothetical protein